MDSKQVPVTNTSDLENHPVWSPDCKLIAYGKERNLWLTNVDGSVTRMIIQNGQDPHWSPDSKWLFNYSQRDNYLYSFDENKNFKSTFPKQVGDLASFSPDCKKVLFYRSSRDMKWPLKIVSSAGGPPFSPILNTDVYNSYWLTDSKKMLALTENDQGYKIFSVTGGPSEEIIIETNVNGKPNPIMFSDDLTKVAFSVTRADELSDIYVAPFSTTEARTTGPAHLVFEGWTAGAFNVYMAWSHDGEKMAFVHEGDIWVIQLNSGKLLRITNTPEKERWINFSPDGNMISFFIPSAQSDILHVIPASGGNSKVLNDDCTGATWLNDSKNIALFSKNNLQVISLDGQKTRQILNIKDIGLANNEISIQVSPDGKSLAFIGYIADNDHSLIITYSMETGKITRLADENLEDGKYLLKWSNDSKWLSFLTYEQVKVRPEGSLWEADFDEIKEKIVKD
jgi:Tol biopolymer transport system component